MSGLFDSRSSYSSTSIEVERKSAISNNAEVMLLSECIAQNIRSIKSSWQQLEKAFKIIGTAKDNSGYREKVHQIQLTTNDKIQMTSKDLQHITDVARASGEKRRQLHVDKITSDFKNVVQMYSSSQRQIAGKMKAIILRMSSQIDSTNRDSVNGKEVAPMLRQKKMRESLRLEEILLLQREQSLQKIEEDVLDVNKIMSDLAMMVNQQAEQIVKIEKDVDEVAVQLEDGTSQLAEAVESQAKYRCKIIALLVIALIVIGLIVTGIIVVRSK